MLGFMKGIESIIIILSSLLEQVWNKYLFPLKVESQKYRRRMFSEIGNRNKRNEIWKEKEEKIIFFKARHYKRFQNIFYRSRTEEEKSGRFYKNNLFSFKK